MTDAPKIKEAIERNVKAVTLRPSVGQGTARTIATLRPGLAAVVEEGDWKVTVGMHEKYGGTNAGPNPGILGRGALASCLAIGIGMWAARLGVSIEALEVVVEADYDVRGELGVSPEVPPGYLAMRYIVNITSASPKAEVEQMVATAVRCSSYVDDYARAVPMAGAVNIVKR